jgi:hypothetical protein
MPLHGGEGFFEALFEFREKDYFTTRHQLFQKCTFETRRAVPRDGSPRVLKERAVFEHSRLGRHHLISSGWHSTPSVAALRTETAELVRTFEQQRPGLLAALRSTSRAAQGQVEEVTGGPATVPWVQCSHTVGESGALHLRFPNAFFQVASQFNMLEFISHEVTPEDGVTHYVYDRTQGPACALACMAGTAYRNYLLHPDLFHAWTTAQAASAVGEQHRGQQATHQLNLLADFTAYLTQAHGTAVPALDFNHFYEMRSGYFHPAPSMADFKRRLEQMAASQGTTLADVEDALRSRLRVGLVEDVTVTLPLHTSRDDDAALPGEVHEVSQSYNSALSLPPLPLPQGVDDAWTGMELLSRIILRGTYEATLLAGVQHTIRSLQQQQQDTSLTSGGDGDGAARASITLPPIFLTKVGGGVFNNDAAWIASAIESAVARVGALGVPLDVRLVHHRGVEAYYERRFPTWPAKKS